MIRRLLLLIFCLATCGGSAAAEGINLSWNDCSTAGTAAKFNDCHDEAAVSELYGSFVAPAGINQFQGMIAELMVSGTDPLPEWWWIYPGWCRPLSDLIVDSDYVTPTCANPFAQPPLIQGYVAEFLGNRLRIRVQVAVAVEDSTRLEAGREYFAFRVRIKNAGSESACFGCETPICLTLMSVHLYQPIEIVNDPILTEPVNRAHVTWQTDVVERCPLTVPVRNTTWGQIRSIYR